VIAQPIAVSGNIAQETGGNLAAIKTVLTAVQASNDILRQISNTLTTTLLLLQANSSTPIGDAIDVLSGDIALFN
jgi:hypothetical protein